MPVTNYFGNKTLNFNFVGTPYIPGDVNKFIYFGLSSTEVAAEDVSCSTVTEPTGSYGRVSSYNGSLAINILGLYYSNTSVQLLVDYPTNYQVGDAVKITGVNTAFSVTNIDGTWVLTDVQADAGAITFEVANPPTGGEPFPIALANVTNMSYIGSNVTLTVDDALSFTNSDEINVTSVNSPAGATNIDGTWTLTSVIGSDLLFTVAHPPTGATPQSMIFGHVYATKYLVGAIAETNNWSTSTNGSLHNNNEIIFNGTSGDTWGPIVSIFIADDGTTGAGNVLAFYTVPTPFTLTDIQLVLPPKSIAVSTPTTCGTLFTINRILNYNFGRHSYTPDDGAGNLHFGLSTTVVDDTGLASITEPPTAANYSRVTYADANWNASTGVNPASGVVNANQITFPTPSATWGEIRSLFLSDSATYAAGNVLWYKTLAPSIYVPLGMIDIIFPASEITFNMT